MPPKPTVQQGGASTRNPPPFSEEVDTGLVHYTYGWDGYIDQPGLATVGICCSGGGIRSASYCLGALQVLRASGYLADADYLAAVSGGDYISVAHTVMVSETLKAGVESESSPTDADYANAEERYFGELAPWALSSPEEEHLRNHSDYLAPGGAGKAWMALNLLYGMLRHLLPFAAGIFLVSAGFAVAYGRVLRSALSAPGPLFPGVPHGLFGPMLWVLIGLGGVAGFALLGRQVVQSRARPNGGTLAHLQRIIMAMIGLQLLLALFGIGLPALLVWIHHRPFGGLFTSAATAAGFEGGSLTLTSLAAYLAKRGATGRKKSAKYLLPLVTTLLGPLIIGVPFVALTYWMTRRESQLWGLPAVLAFVSIGLLVTFTFISEAEANMHLFYRERLSSVFIGLRRLRRERDGDDYLSFDEPPWAQPVWFSDIREGTGKAKLPKLVVCAAVNVSQDVPPGRLAASFTFEKDYSGGPLTGYLPTQELEALAGKSILTLPAMMGISGAAVSPSMGKMTRPWLRLLLALFNARLGVWLPNPWWNDPLRAHQLHRAEAARRVGRTVSDIKGELGSERVRRRFRSPGTLYALREALGLNDARRPFVYVTDGGHWENLGLVELLRRGCGQVLCFDAAGDDLAHFSTLSQAIALARSELGVRIEIDLEALRPKDDGFSDSDVATGRIRYPDGKLGVLVLAKLAMPKDAPQDAKAYRDRDSKFPTNPTSDQLFNDQKFESYHALGRHAGTGAVRAMNEWRRATSKPPLPPVPAALPNSCAGIEQMVPNPFRVDSAANHPEQAS
jgi:hypothetical protein